MSKTHCIYYRYNVERTQRYAKAGDDSEASRLPTRGRINTRPLKPNVEKLHEKRIEGEMLYTVQSGSYDLYRDLVHLHEYCLVSTYQLELLTNKLNQTLNYIRYIYTKWKAEI